MENGKFDDLARFTFSGSSRRGVVRAGAGALVASALATLGLIGDDVEAKKKKKKKKKKKTTPVEVCPADLPVSCGGGCCPTAYSLCCVGNFGGFGGGLAVLRAAGDSTCNPPSFNCCPVDQGGGSCGGRFPKCCPATTQAPFGSCARTDDVCCTTETGGFSCPADRPVCCLQDPSDIFDSGNCCPTGSSCCQVAADCPGGVGPCVNGCCPGTMRETVERASGRVRQGGVERFHMRAR